MWWMFWAIWCIGALIVLAYAFVLPFGAPYLPTLKKQAGEALDFLDLKPGQLFVDLGCGDGRLLVLAASKGLRVVGYELNPFLVFIAWMRTRRYGRQVQVKWRSFWGADLSEANGVYVFLIDHFMRRLDRMLSRQARKHQIKLVSNAFRVPGKQPLKQKGALLLYVYKPG